jgi:hypothetical protein
MLTGLGGEEAGGAAVRAVGLQSGAETKSSGAGGGDEIWMSSPDDAQLMIDHDLRGNIDRPFAVNTARFELSTRATLRMAPARG